MSRSKIFFFLFLFSCAMETIAQGSATIKAVTDKNKILIGEPLQLSVEVYFSTESLKTFSLIDSIPHFEFLETPVVDTINKVGGLSLRCIYKITSFDSGHWVIPSIVLYKGISTDTIPVDVVFSDFNPQQDYHDIKDILEIKEAKKKNWIWYAITGSVLLVLLFYFLLKKKKKPEPVITTPVLNAFEVAMKQLNLLQKETVSGKVFHTKLVGIFRLYVLQKKNILSLQKTTNDLVLQLKPVVNSNEIFNQIQQALSLSDFVKFAKYLPSDEDNRSAVETIKKSIEHIEQLP